MRNGWTGGQYSLFRVVLAIGLLWIFWTAPTRPAGSLMGVLLLLGCFHRPAAAGSLLLLAYLYRDAPVSLLVWAWVPVAHLFVPPAPYGSWAARGRRDPDGGWRMPGHVFLCAWILLAALYTWTGIEGVRRGSPWMAALAFAPLALVPRLRPWIWLAGFGVSMVGAPRWDVVFIHLFTFDPAWIPGRIPDGDETMRYDGNCGLCHRGVRWGLAEDRTLLFEPLEAEDPDTVVVETATGDRLVRSAAVLHMARRMGGLWRVLAFVGALIPRPLRDWLYDRVAAVRHHFFQRPRDTCPLVTPELRRRFH